MQRRLSFVIITVMATCYVCHKSTLKGHRVSHSNIKTRRFFKPNLHTLKVEFQDKAVKQLKICSKCYKKIQADFWDGKRQRFIPISLLNQKRIKDKTVSKEPVKVNTKQNGKEKGTKS